MKIRLWARLFSTLCHNIFVRTWISFSYFTWNTNIWTVWTLERFTHGTE